MIARVQKSMQEKDKGFTLIELLVVIIIIGILSAIAIPVFMNQRKKAVDAGIKSDLRTIANEMETMYVDDQAYPTGSQSGKTVTLTGKGTPAKTVAVTISEETSTYTVAAGTDPNSYVITGTNASKGTGAKFTYDSSKGGMQP